MTLCVTKTFQFTCIMLQFTHMLNRWNKIISSTRRPSGSMWDIDSELWNFINHKFQSFKEGIPPLSIQLYFSYHIWLPSLWVDTFVYTPPEIIFWLSLPRKHRCSPLSQGCRDLILKSTTIPLNCCWHQVSYCDKTIYIQAPEYVLIFHKKQYFIRRKQSMKDFSSI